MVAPETAFRNPVYLTDLLQLGALADPADMTVVAAWTLFGPFACFPDDPINPAAHDLRRAYTQ
ncbi:MAG TPA: hypothetical protein VGG79_07025 [Roseiarcus sp.]|jgi:hypothetical protein